MIEMQITQTFSNDLLDLATNGTTDTYNFVYNSSTNPEPFLTLKKGWITILKESTRSHKVNTTGDANVIASFDKAIQALPSRFKTPLCKLIVSPKVLEDYNKLLAPQDHNAVIAQTGSARSRLGFGIEVNPYMPDDVIIFSDPKDLAVAMGVLGTQRAMENKPRLKTIQYTYTLPVDFEIVRDRAMVIAFPQT